MHGGPVQMSRYNAGESLLLKAGWPVAENIREVWKKPTTADFAGPKQLGDASGHAPTFVDTYVLSTPTFC
jgi:hypothetical protein